MRCCLDRNPSPGIFCVDFGYCFTTKPQMCPCLALLRLAEIDGQLSAFQVPRRSGAQSDKQSTGPKPFSREWMNTPPEKRALPTRQLVRPRPPGCPRKRQWALSWSVSPDLLAAILRFPLPAIDAESTAVIFVTLRPDTDLNQYGRTDRLASRQPTRDHVAVVDVPKQRCSLNTGSSPFTVIPTRPFGDSRPVQQGRSPRSVD